MFLSVIIVNYKTPVLLENCIKSIISNPPSCDYEIIVADNNSCDGSESVSKYERVRYLALPENGGFSYANNRGLEQAKGDYILFLNPDTIINPNVLSKALNKASEDKIGCVGVRLETSDGTLDYACRRGFPTLKNSIFKFCGLDRIFKTKFFSGYNLLYLDEHENYPVDCVVGAFMMMKKSILNEIGGFDERFFMYGEDIDLCLRIHNAGYTNYYLGSQTIIHKKRASSKKSDIAKKAFYSSMWLYYEKHHSKNHSALTNKCVHFAIRILEKLKG